MARITDVLVGKKAFIWDFDGCLCDSERSHYLAYAKAFAHFGHTIHEGSYYATFTHLGNGTEREIQQHNLSCTPAEIASLKNAAYRNLINSNQIPLFAEIPSIIEAMHLSGAKVAIASNSPVEELSSILKNNSLEHAFDLIVGRTPQLRKKPFPDIFLHTLSTLGLSSSEVLIFEDADKGLEAAQHAGCDCVWVKTQFNSGLTSQFPRVSEVTHIELLRAVQQVFVSAQK